jgi:hypothetical protein
MASVAMNGGSRPAVIISPLASPAAAPTARPATIANPIGHPASANVHAVTTLPSASTDPTDRSMPPEMITEVIPRARMARMEICWRTLNRFRRVKKKGERIDSTITRRTRPARGPEDASHRPSSSRPMGKRRVGARASRGGAATGSFRFAVIPSPPGT